PATIFPEYNLAAGVTVESPEGLFARGSIMRGVFADRKSPIAYGFDAQVPVYFSQEPVLYVGTGGGGGGGRGDGPAIPGVGMNITPMASASQQRLSTWDPEVAAGAVAPPAGDSRGSRGDGSQTETQGRGTSRADEPHPRVVLQFPSNVGEMLLS